MANNNFRRPLNEKNEFPILPGDTLSSIAKLITGNANDYKLLAELNDIKDPNKIIAGKSLKIPLKFNKPLKLKEIPTKNAVRIIDNYSPNYNYIIELDKIYYAKKNKDYWVDISDNEVARKNLYNFIGNKYNFRGYEDDENNILKKVNAGTFNYKAYRDSVNNASSVEPLSNVPRRPLRMPKLALADVAKNDNTTVASKTYYDPKTKKVMGPIKITQPKKEENVDAWYNVGAWFTKGLNWLERQTLKQVDSAEDITNLKLPYKQDKNSAYGLRPGSFTGDTIKVNARRYFLPESIDANDYTFGFRNRGDYTPISSEAASITTFSPLRPFGKHNKNFKTYIGIDKNHNLVVGDISNFSEGSYLAGTYANDVASFKKDALGNVVMTRSRKNPRQNQPVPIIYNNGKLIDNPTSLAVNILVRRDDKKGNTFGNITGGRVLVKTGNEVRLLSGSVLDIDRLFEAMKKRNNVAYGTFYTLDNGSYNRGLRTKDLKFTSLDLKNYDMLNNGGGNFIYIRLPRSNAFSSDTIWTPNIRTVNDESYKKGHGLVNERKGVLLHHTAFMEPNLQPVTNHLTRPNGESSHVIIGYDGHRRVLAKPENVTFHAGKSVWNNRDNVNDFMIGIEFLGDTNRKPLTDAQIKSAVEYLKPIIRENNISLENITTHSKVRELYNEYAEKNKMQKAPHKPDITELEYHRIIAELLKSVYYKL